MIQLHFISRVILAVAVLCTLRVVFYALLRSSLGLFSVITCASSSSVLLSALLSCELQVKLLGALLGNFSSEPAGGLRDKLTGEL